MFTGRTHFHRRGLRYLTAPGSGKIPVFVLTGEHIFDMLYSTGGEPVEPLYAKQMLTPLKGTMDDWYYSNWNMNIYRGCSHGCIYCDSRSTCYHLDHFDTVRPKENALSLLETELRGKRKTGIISTGAMSDPYNPLEKELQLTRGALELVRKYRFGWDFTTKSALCVRDIDLLQGVAEHAPVCARFSITCADDELSRKVEPHVSPSSERFNAVRQLSAAGIYTGVWLNPMLPFITDSEDNLVRILRTSAEAGAKFVVCFFSVTLRDGDRDYFFRALTRDFPGVREKYLTTYGNDYVCAVPDADHLYTVFKSECKRLGLAYRFREINEGLLARQPVQQSMF